jgi:hypothetical protein
MTCSHKAAVLSEVVSLRYVARSAKSEKRSVFPIWYHTPDPVARYIHTFCRSNSLLLM